MGGIFVGFDFWPYIFWGKNAFSVIFKTSFGKLKKKSFNSQKEKNVQCNFEGKKFINELACYHVGLTMCMLNYCFILSFVNILFLIMALSLSWFMESVTSILKSITYVFALEIQDTPLCSSNWIFYQVSHIRLSFSIVKTLLLVSTVF